jgi:anti-sigma B factor antagonist
MEIQFSEMNNGLRAIKLSGELDIIGVGQVETKFAGFCSGDRVHVVVDMSDVSYLASIGIRLLVMNAKSLATRSGKMALLNPNENVLRVLEISGIPAIIPIYSSMESVEAVLLGS